MDFFYTKSLEKSVGVFKMPFLAFTKSLDTPRIFVAVVSIDSLIDFSLPFILFLYSFIKLFTN